MRRTAPYPLVAPAIALALALGGCASETSVFVRIVLPATPQADQLVITAHDGEKVVVGPLPEPATRGAPLSGTQTLRILLADTRGDRTLRFDVEGRSGADTVLVGQASARLATGHEVTVDVAMQPAHPGSTVRFAAATTTVAESVGTVTLDLRLTPPTVGPLELPYTVGGTARLQEDHDATDGILEVPAGSAAAHLTFHVLNDRLHEHEETVVFTLQTLTGASLAAPASAVVVITDDDAPPTLSLADATIDEGGEAVVRATLSEASGVETAFDWTTLDGTATQATGDYAATQATVHLPAGQTVAELRVATLQDTVHESSETLEVRLFGVSDAIGPARGATVTIRDDDAPPSLSVAGTSVIEGAPALFALAVSAASEVDLEVTCVSGDRTATTASGDYLAVAQRVRIPAGAVKGTCVVPTLPDRLHENDETFTVTLSAPLEASLAVAAATGTIVDDDPLPSLAVDAAQAVEGQALSFRAHLDAPSGLDVTFDVATRDGTAHLADADYTAVGATMTIAAGQTEAFVTVPSTADTRDEPDETLTLALTNVVGASGPAADATGTIVDDDPTPRLSVEPASAPEGAPLAFRVTLDAVSGRDVDVTYATTDGTATVADGDYTAATGTAHLPAGTTTTTVRVTVLQDARYEDDETLRLTLSGPVGALLGAATALGTIANDDPLPVVTVAAAQAVEGLPVVFTLSLDAASGRDLSLRYATTAGTATEGVDYDAATGTLTIPAGSRSATVAVATRQDALDEDDETFTLALASPVTATLGTADHATGTIVDDDPTPSLTLCAPATDEGQSLTATLTLSAPSGRAVSFAFATEDGSASAAGGDYDATSGTRSLDPGTTSATFAVPVRPDALDEDDETFTLRLSSLVNATIAAPVATATIREVCPHPSCRYVSVLTGSDTNAGDRASRPWKTLSRLRATPAPAGTFVLLHRGQTWREELSVAAAGTAAAPVTVAGYGSGARPQVSGADLVTRFTLTATDVWSASVTGAAPGALWTDDAARTPRPDVASLSSEGDFTFDLRTHTLSLFSTSDPALRWTSPGVEIPRRPFALRSVGQQGLAVRELSLRHAAGDGVRFDDALDVTLTDLVADANGRDGLHLERTGVNESGRVAVTRCRFTRNAGAGAYVQSSTAGGLTALQFAYDLLDRNGQAGLRLDDAGGHPSEAHLTNLTLVGNGTLGAGAGLEGALVDGSLLNLVFSDNNASGAGTDELSVFASGATTVDRLLLAHVGGTAGWGGVTSTLAGFLAARVAHGFAVAAGFTDAAAGDYTLAAGSAAIDAGAPTGFTRDLAGRPVPAGNAPDLGAFERP